jgi:Stress responsive A/B Barrel Domain
LLRHTALFLFKDTTTPPEKMAALKGLAYLSYGCPSVQAVDFGTDLFDGSSPLLDIKPWKRTPLWNARSEGPPSNFDMALHLDFDDLAGLEDYNKDDVHHEVAVYNAAVCRGEFTARVDWNYDGPSRIDRFGVRHTALFLWLDDAGDAQKNDVAEGFRALSSVPGVRSSLAADNVGTLTTDYDLVVDVTLDDVDSARGLLDHPAYKEATSLAAANTKYEWTARITHTMAAG